MSRKTREVRVHLSAEGKAELSDLVRPWLQIGELGPYLQCRKVHADGAYFQMIFELHDSEDDDSTEIEFNVPHRFIKGFVSLRGSTAFDQLYGAPAASRPDQGGDDAGQGGKGQDAKRKNASN